MTQYMDPEELWLPDDPKVEALMRGITGTPGGGRVLEVTNAWGPADPYPEVSCTCAHADLFGCFEVGCQVPPPDSNADVTED